jgi:uncharacterized membrane protein YciS (DUF1049 family)
MSIVLDRRSAEAKQWARRQLPTVVIGIVFLVLWEVVARVIGSNRIVADIPYTVSSLVAEADTISMQVGDVLVGVRRVRSRRSIRR